MKKKLSYLCLFSLLSMLLFAACGKKENKNNPNYNSDNYLSGTYYALIQVENYGPIYLELDADAAPATVTNFVNLVNEGFYNGLTFHRICDGFMIQGGDPEGNGTGGSTYTVPGEFALNKFENPISHVRGTISMARTNDYDSASSQFFIVHQDSTGLDGGYAAFGHVISGMEYVDAICADTITEDENGLVLPENQPVISSITILNEDEVVTDDSSDAVVDDTVELPAPTAVINFIQVDSAEGIPLEDSLVVDEDGAIFFISSSLDLLSLSLYETDLTNGITYDVNHPLVSTSDLGANTFISLKLNVPKDGLPTQLLVAEEHNGALGKYLISYDANTDSAYLVPVIE